MLEQSLAEFYGALSARGISPDIQLPEEKIVRTLDPVALRRIYDNILSNAVKYSAGGLVISLLPAAAETPAASETPAAADWGCPSQGF